MKKEIKKIITLPENVHAKIEGRKVIVKGPLGEVEKSFNFKGIKMELKDKTITIMHEKATKKEKKMINTMASKISSAVEGVVKGFEYKLQICSIHFPITIKVDKANNLLIIKNFLGENKDRVVGLSKNSDINVEGDIITVKSADKDIAGNMAANIEHVTRVKARDRRIFQDGIWIIKKEKGRLR